MSVIAIAQIPRQLANQKPSKSAFGQVRVVRGQIEQTPGRNISAGHGKAVVQNSGQHMLAIPRQVYFDQPLPTPGTGMFDDIVDDLGHDQLNRACIFTVHPLRTQKLPNGFQGFAHCLLFGRKNQMQPGSFPTGAVDYEFLCTPHESEPVRKHWQARRPAPSWRRGE